MEKLIYIVGIGPGDEKYLTSQARTAIEESDVIVGYTVYNELLKKAYPDKTYIATAMKQEIDRCRKCYELAMEGKRVSLICSGDAGVYGMASPMFELKAEYEDIELEVIPGITAALSGSAELGAAVGHDFCVISLSDLLTPFEVIERRLKAAIMGDFVIAIYNPSSKKRADYLKRAIDIMLEAGAEPDRVCGFVENIGREDTKTYTGTLSELRDMEVNMFTTVFIGNSESYISEGKIITKRGYR